MDSYIATAGGKLANTEDCDKGVGSYDSSIRESCTAKEAHLWSSQSLHCSSRDNLTTHTWMHMHVLPCEWPYLGNPALALRPCSNLEIELTTRSQSPNDEEAGRTLEPSAGPLASSLLLSWQPRLSAFSRISINQAVVIAYISPETC